MISFSKRRFLGQMGAVAGSGLIYSRGFPLAFGAETEASGGDLWSVNAGEVSVARGPWPAADNLSPGVRFESLYLRQPDGVHLDCLMYLPGSIKRGEKVPALIKADPYRGEPVGNGSREYDGLARNGFAAIYVHVRGTGASEGIPTDEYAPDEYGDIVRIIDWLSKQPWCNGNVGMFGQSYSAFNAIWTAVLNPPALKAIFCWAGTDDRYQVDIHSPGGTMLMYDHDWALGMITSVAAPGAPLYNMNDRAAMDRWNQSPWIDVFLHNQLYGPHYQRGSLAPDYSRLKTPIWVGSGNLDIYPDFAARIMKYSPAPSMGVIGPYTHSRFPGTVVDWDAIRVRWFDHWLKGKDTGMLREPRLAFYMQEWRRQVYRDKGPVPGEWRYLNEWPDTAFTDLKRLYLRPRREIPLAEALQAEPSIGTGGELSEMSPKGSALKLKYQASHGGMDQAFYNSNTDGYWGIDSRDEDTYGLCFDTPPLRDPTEILGIAKAHLHVASSAPVANWIVRIQDLAPDGTSYMVTRGYFNGTHRKSHSHPEALTPEEIYELDLELTCASYKFSPGHCIRVVVSNACFPVIWPSPYAMTTTLYTGGDHPSFIALPILPKAPRYLSGTLPLAADQVRPSVYASYGPREPVLTVTREYTAGTATAVIKQGKDEITCKVDDANPAQASIHLKSGGNARKSLDGRTIETRADGIISSDAENFFLDLEITLLEDDKVVRSKRWQDKIRREQV